MDSKPWYLSKTLWANLLAGGVVIATVFGLDLGLTPESQAEIVAGVLVIANLILRLVTNRGIR